MKKSLMSVVWVAGLGMLSGCGLMMSTAEVRAVPAVYQQQLNVAYRPLSQCLHQRMNDEQFALGARQHHDLYYQDWKNSAEVVASTGVDTAYLAVVQQGEEGASEFSLHVSPLLITPRTTTLVEKFQLALHTCQELLS